LFAALSAYNILRAANNQRRNAMDLVIRTETTYKLEPAAYRTGSSMTARELCLNVLGRSDDLVEGEVNARILQRAPEVEEIVKSGKRLCFPERRDGFFIIWVLRWFNGQVYLARRSSERDLYDENDLLVYYSKT
jgi:hypothetical protein